MVLGLLLLLVATTVPRRGTSSRRRGRLGRGRRKTKEGKGREEAGGQAGSYPQVQWSKVCGVGGAGKYVSGGMWGDVAGGAKVVRGSADPLQVTVEGRTVPRTELGQGGAVGPGEGVFLHSDRRGWRSEDNVNLASGLRPVDSFGV